MARARNIKPSFFQNDALGELPPLARLLFIGMWTIADFKGCLEFRPKRIKAQLLPYDECDVEALTSALDQSRFVTIYSVAGQRYVKITNFEKHQNPHPNEKKTGSEIPDVDQSDAQVVDFKRDATARVKIAINHEQDGTDPADSLIPHPSSPIPQPLSDAGAPGGVERRAEKLDAVEDILPVGDANLPAAPAKREVDADFERAWQAYPKRDGGNPRKDALTAWKARRKEGVPAEDMIAGVERYAAHMQSRGKIGTPYVMQAATFFGPSARYAEAWPAEAPREIRTNGRPSMNAPFVAGSDADIFDQLPTDFRQ